MAGAAAQGVGLSETPAGRASLTFQRTGFHQQLPGAGAGFLTAGGLPGRELPGEDKPSPEVKRDPPTPTAEAPRQEGLGAPCAAGVPRSPARVWPLALPSTMDSGRTRRRPVSLLTSTRATAPSGPSGPSITAHLRHSASRLLSSPGGDRVASVDRGHHVHRPGPGRELVPHGRAHVAQRPHRGGLWTQPLHAEQVSAGGLTTHVTSPVVSTHPDAAPAAGHGAHPSETRSLSSASHRGSHPGARPCCGLRQCPLAPLSVGAPWPCASFRKPQTRPNCHRA